MKEQIKYFDKDTKKQIKTQIQIQNEKKDAEKSPNEEEDIKSPKEDNERAPEEENDWIQKEKEKYLSIRDEIENMPKNETTEKQKMKTEKEISKMEINKKKTIL